MAKTTKKPAVSPVAPALDACLADCIDLHSQIKVAHWNIKGPHFASLHPLLDTFATGLALHVDAIAERAVQLGIIVHGTARHVAKASRLPEYPQETTRDLEHVRLLIERFDVAIAGMKKVLDLAAKRGDDVTVDLMTVASSELGKNRWFLQATLG